jgi:hypothetical protein
MTANEETRYYPEGEFRWYGGIHKVQILPESEFNNCERRYSQQRHLSENTLRKKCYPCLVVDGFQIRRENGLQFNKDEKVLLTKALLKKKHRDTWKKPNRTRRIY